MSDRRARLVATVASLDPRLPRTVWTLEAGGLVNSFGTGLVLPFVVIYLHNVRGFSLATAGLVLATISLASLVTSPLLGPLIDRIGGRATLAGSLVALAVGYGLFPLVREPWQAFLVAALAGIGNGGFWPAQSTLVAGLTPARRLHAAYALQRVTRNLGIGLGGLTGGLIATTTSPGTFTILFVVDAVTFLGYVLVLPLVPNPTLPPRSGEEARSGYLTVLRHRALMGIVLLNALLVSVGYAQFELLPAFAKNEAGVSEMAIGIVFLVNTIVIVVAQLPIARLLEGRRRMRALALMPLLWAAAWVVVELGGSLLETAAAAAVFCAAAVLFGLGECFHGPTQGALVADLAPPHLRGRAFALSSNSWELGFVIGPAVGGLILATEPFALWPLAAAVCVVAAGATLLLERTVPAGLRLTPG